ncbi:MAG: hypothetical protein J0M11_12205 [Anaerolineae bacterium]|jgi:hypothetical protein|nr:hypothetical protein [Anaerolineae bacterium]
MKKIFSTIFILIALLAMTTGAAFAGSALELVEVRNDEGQPKFVFRVTGEFSKEELESGFVQVDGGDAYPLYCAQTAPDTVVCHTSQVVAGHNVVIGFGGARFWDKVPERGPAAQYCYPVYDWNNDGENIPTYWALQGTHCQDNEAQFGDMIFNFYAPDYDSYYDYQYLPGDFCGWVDPGEAYYYPFCPDAS